MNTPTIHEAKRCSLSGSDTICYHYRRSALYEGLIYTAFFIIIGIASTIIMIVSKDALYPKTMAFVFALFWSFWVLLGIWTILQYFKALLFISDTHIESIGVVKRKTIAFDKVFQVVWRTGPTGGSVVLRTSDQKIVIEFNNYTKDQQKEIVELIHKIIPLQLQNGWSRFYGLISRQHKPRSEFSKTSLVLDSLIVFAFVPVFVYFWRTGQGISYLIVSIICIIAALLFLGISFKKKKRKLET
jgi:hypothetical protein